MALVGYSPFADLRGAEVSQKKSNWSKNEKDLDSVVRAQLRNANLRYALALNAFLAGADLSKTDLSYADLSETDLSYADLSDVDLAGTHMGGADLSGAYLGGAHLSDTDLRGADLSDANLSCLDLRGGYLAGAHLSDADLSDADLSGVDLHYADLSGVYLVGAHVTYTDFRMAKNLNLETVKSALHWEKAFYDDETLKALGLLPDHNAKLAEQQKKEKELQQKQDAGQTAPKPTPPKQ
jgi:uncharacterized protein YjbI with pentapeptide repeats